MKYDEDTLREIRVWLSSGHHANNTQPDCWVDESLEYCLTLIMQLKDENESLWMMLEEFRNSVPVREDIHEKHTKKSERLDSWEEKPDSKDIFDKWSEKKEKFIAP